MKVFCSYAYTGEELSKVVSRTQKVVDMLKEAGHDVYCPLFDERVASLQETNDMKAIFAHAFDGIKRQDVLVAIIASERRSEGQLMEIGAALSRGVPVYLLQHTSAKDSSYLPALVTKTVTWTDDAELEQAARTLLV